MDEQEGESVGSRRSTGRRRRSTRGYLAIDKEEELCEYIPISEPDDKRLEMLMQMCAKHALENTLQMSEVADHVDKSSAMIALTSTIDELRNENAFKQAVNSVKNDADMNVDVDLEKNIKVAENYISKLKTESRDWEHQMGHHENKAVAMRREVENFSTAVSKEPNDGDIKYQERMDKIKAFYDKLNTQCDNIGKAADAIDQFQTSVEKRISDEKAKYDSAMNELNSSIFKIIKQWECKGKSEV